MVSFKEMTKPLSKNRLMIVDSMNLAFRWLHRKSKVFAEEYIRTVESLARSYDCGSIVIAGDWGGSSYRKAIFPEYKANRKEKYKDQSEEDKEYMKAFFEELGNTLDLLEEKGYPVFRYQGVEADDIAAMLVHYREDYMFDHIWLISSDRDWDLLVDDNVSRFSYVTRQEQTPENWDNKVSMEHYLTFKCLNGDSGDNIPGVAGVGPVRAQKVIEQYGSVFDIYDHCPLPGKAKYIQSINDFAEQLLLNVELMDLKTYFPQAIGKDNMEDIHRRMVRGN